MTIGAPRACSRSLRVRRERSFSRPTPSASVVPPDPNNSRIDRSTAASPVEDLARFEELHALGSELRLSDLERCDAASREALELALRIGADGTLARAWVLRALYQRDRSEGDQGMEALAHAAACYKRLGDTDGCIRMAVLQARIHDRLSDFRSALDALLPWADAVDTMSSSTRAQYHCRLGITYMQLGDMANAHACALKSLALAELSDSDQDRVNAYGLAMGLYANLGMLARAKELAVRSLELHDEATGGLTILGNLASVTAQLGEHREALGYLDQLVARARAEKRLFLEATMLGNRAAVKLLMGRHRAALRDAAAALAMGVKLGDRSREAAALRTMGAAYGELGDTEKGIDHAERAFAIVAELNLPIPVSQMHHTLARLYHLAGRHDRAFEHLETHRRMREEQHASSTLGALSDLLQRLEMEKLEREGETLRLEAEHMQREMERRNAELTALALHLVEKREFLESVDQRVRAVAATSGEDIRERLGDLAREIRNNLAAEGEWAAFEERFSTVHGAFLAALSARHPELSATELKVCALMRINLDTKEIARMLSSSVRTIQNHRYSIRKKLGLSDRENMASALGVMR